MRQYLPIAVLLATTSVMPALLRGDETMDVICKAFRASSSGLRSGIGTGKYRHCESKPGEEWQLKIDADLRACFDGRKYRVDLRFERDMLGLDARRIIFDGATIADMMLSRNIHPSGAQAWLSTPHEYDHGLAHLAWGEFPWDVSCLAKNVWVLEQLRNNKDSWQLKIEKTPDGDLVGINSSAEGGYRIRFEWPRRFGFNLGRKQLFNPGADHPCRDSSLQWQRDQAGLWYVRSLQETFETYKQRGKPDIRFRAVLMYNKFEPNAKVDPKLFVADTLELPAGSQIIDNRTEGKALIRRTR